MFTASRFLPMHYSGVTITKKHELMKLLNNEDCEYLPMIIVIDLMYIPSFFTLYLENAILCNLNRWMQYFYNFEKYHFYLPFDIVTASYFYMPRLSFNLVFDTFLPKWTLLACCRQRCSSLSLSLHVIAKTCLDILLPFIGVVDELLFFFISTQIFLSSMCPD